MLPDLFDSLSSLGSSLPTIVTSRGPEVILADLVPLDDKVPTTPGLLTQPTAGPVHPIHPRMQDRHR